MAQRERCRHWSSLSPSLFVLAFLLTLLFWGINSHVSHVEAGEPVSMDKTYRISYSDEAFPLDIILDIEVADFNGDGRAELAVLGKKYETLQTLIHVVELADNKLKTVWTSPNLYRAATVTLMTAGKFGPEEAVSLAVFVGSSVSRYVWRQSPKDSRGEMIPVETIELSWVPGEASSGDLDGAGADEIIVSSVVQLTDKTSVEKIRAFRWKEGQILEVSASPAVGNIRALTAGDLTGDGRAEVVLETGEGTRAGKIEVWKAPDPAGKTGGEFERLSSQKLRERSAFGLAAGRLYLEDENSYQGVTGAIVVADEMGKLSIYRWIDRSPGAGSFEQATTELGLGWGLVSAATGDLNGDGAEELVAAGYPNRIYVLSPVTGPWRIYAGDKLLNDVSVAAVIDGAVYVWTRDLPKILNIDFEWIASTKTIRLSSRSSGITVELRIGERKASVDGRQVELRDPARLRDGSSMVPLADVAGWFGIDAGIDPSSRKIQVGRR